MESLRDEVNRRFKAGEYRAKLRQYCHDWKQYRTPLPVANVVRYAAEDDRADDLYAVLIDEDFRTLRQSQFGINDVRADLQIGREYFSERCPDLLRYMQIVFLEHATVDDPQSLRTHQRHCLEFGAFLQLDRLPAERLDLGLHRAIRRFFPIRSDPDDWAQGALDGPVTVRLIGYELGTWTCSCSSRTGFLQRYEFACPCGSLSGNGRLPPNAASCSQCGHMPGYVVCADCGTRVTLEVLWQLRRGGAHPSTHRIPLILDLVVGRPGADPRSARFTLMYLPLLLGLQEREESIVFELPDMLWLGEFSGGFDDLYASSKFVSLNDLPRYDKQTELCKILEAAFRRTLCGRGGYRQFRNELLNRLVREHGYSTDLTVKYTRGFENCIGRNLSTPDWRPEDLLRFVDISADCTVAATPALRDNVVLANRRLTEPGFLSAPHLVHVRGMLKNGSVFTRDPPYVAAHLTQGLDGSGLVLPGQRVEPGQILAGIAAPVDPREVTAEERLLSAIYEKPVFRNNSLVMTGDRPGRVLAVHISLLEGMGGEIPPAPGRFIEYLGPWDTARITITVAIDQPLETGDVLLGEAESAAVVCGIVGGAALRTMTGAQVEPDLVVEANHPWAPLSDGPATRVVRVRLKKNDLVGRNTTSRATGSYSLVSQRPVFGEAIEGFAQVLEPADFQFLITCGAYHLAFELYGPRSDCIEWRFQLYKSLLRDGRPAEFSRTPVREWSSLQDSPSEAIRHWDRLLRSARMKPHLAGERITLEPMTDADVLADSNGEVKKPATLHYATLLPENDGLFCERIFGPDGAWECACGKYRGNKHAGAMCEQCGVEVAHRSPRRCRMGHIELPTPMVHGWYLSGSTGARVAALLHLAEEDLRGIADCSWGVVADPGSAPFRHGQLLHKDEWSLMPRNHAGSGARVVTGGEAIEVLLQQTVSSRPPDLSLEGIVIRRLPVLPPDLRPMLRTADGQFRTTDLNYLYRAVIHDAAQLRVAMQRYASEATHLDARFRLQRSIEQLLDNSLVREPSHDRSGRNLVSLADWLSMRTERPGTIRDGFLHRPVDYSGRTRLVIGETPNLDTALLPSRLAWDLFRPIAINKLTSAEVASSERAAKEMVDAHAETALPTLRAICARSLILVSLASGPWRLVGMRVQLTSELALRVQPTLLDHVGWDNLGGHVNIFSVLTDEAAWEAATRLMPSRLVATVTRPSSVDLAAQLSVFDLAPEELAGAMCWAALNRRSFQLTPQDHLLLCDADWPLADS